MEPIIKIENLSLTYGTHEVLKGINLDIEKNKITSIIGPSGCGKSTLLKCLNRIIEENNETVIKGSILFENENIMNLPIEDVRKNIGMVFQQPSPFPMSVYKNLEYAMKYYGIKKKEREERIHDILKLTGLYDEVKESLNKSALKLSGGQAQRLCIGRALTISPKIILLDEPCSALDVINTKKIEELLLELKKEYTIVIVTHNLSQAKRISDNTVFIYDGEVVEKGATKEVFSCAKEKLTIDYIEGTF